MAKILLNERFFEDFLAALSEWVLNPSTRIFMVERHGKIAKGEGSRHGDQTD